MKMFTGIANKTRSRLAKLSLRWKKETAEEKRNKEELVATIKRLDSKSGDYENAWDRYRSKLRQYIANNDPRNFLMWEPVKSSMFHVADKSEFDHIVASKQNPWLKLIEESWVGNPPKYRHYRKSSGNLIHTAYNLSQLTDDYSIDIKKIGSVVEFGAGYGSMAMLINRLGFVGTYTIFDIPEFQALQKYYLSLNNAMDRASFVDSIDKLEARDTDLLIATWSLSEAPIALRDAFLKKIGKSRYVLIAYQANFGSIDNVEYFKGYTRSNPDYEWTDSEIKQLPGNHYLIGRKKIDKK